MKAEIRILKVILTLADIGVLLICVLFAADDGFQNFAMSPLEVFPVFAPSRESTPPATSTVLIETGIMPTPTVLMALAVPSASGISLGNGGEDTIKYEIPVSPEWTPRRYTFAGPNSTTDPFFNYGDRIYYSEERQYAPGLYIEFKNLNPRTVIEGIIIEYTDREYLPVIFELYRMESESPLSLADETQIVSEEEGITCVQIIYHVLSGDHAEDIYHYYCYAQRKNRLILTHGENMEKDRRFLSEYLGGNATKEYEKYFPALAQLAELEKQIGIISCRTWNEDSYYSYASAGEDETEVTIPLDVFSISVRMECSIREEGMEGLELTIFSMETKWMMDQLIDAAYTMALLDIELRHLTEYYIQKEGPLLVRYTGSGGIWVHKQIGNSCLTLDLSYRKYRELNEKPTDMAELIETLEDLAMRITYPEIDTTQIENIFEYEGGWASFYELGG
jgi:hypothetical protein